MSTEKQTLKEKKIIFFFGGAKEEMEKNR
jgi:hypothetical protein